MEILGLTFAALALVVLLAVVIPAALVWLAIRIVGLVFRVLGLRTAEPAPSGGRQGRIAMWAQRTVADLGNLVGSVIACVGLGLFSLARLLTLSPRASRVLFDSSSQELLAAVAALYRIALGHPLRLLGLHGIVRSLEERIPAALAASQTAGHPAVPTNRADHQPTFPGYDIVRELVAGGSGARLFVARPDRQHAALLSKRGRSLPDLVVVKDFALTSGSTLPQILRESRALEPAGRLGLVLDHHLDDERFYYVMPYVEGPTLEDRIKELHAEESTLGTANLELVTHYAHQLCTQLERFHDEGLWHKDVKPANLIASSEGLQLVDLGLVTPLSSALTLTTHGTEYFRDPELVRLALRGTRVNEVDGARFDVYGAGAVLYALLEGTFPANGSLTPFEKESPEGLRFIVRRAMADLESRYPDAATMRRDLEAVLAAPDPSSVKPLQLPSMGGPEAPGPGPTPQPNALGSPVAEPGGSVLPHGRERATGPVTAAASAVAWTEIGGRRAPDRTARRRQRSALLRGLGVLLFVTLAGFGVLGLMKPAFHDWGGSESHDEGPGHTTSLRAQYTDAALYGLAALPSDHHREVLILQRGEADGRVEFGSLPTFVQQRHEVEAPLLAQLELALQVTEGGTPEQRRFALEQALAEASPGDLEVLLIESDALGAPTVLLTQVWRSDGDR